MSTKQIALRLPDDILASLRAQAEAEYRTVTSLAIALIAEGLTARGALEAKQAKP